jgi:hypothetical protein
MGVYQGVSPVGESVRALCRRVLAAHPACIRNAAGLPCRPGRDEGDRRTYRAGGSRRCARLRAPRPPRRGASRPRRSRIHPSGRVAPRLSSPVGDARAAVERAGAFSARRAPRTWRTGACRPCCAALRWWYDRRFSERRRTIRRARLTSAGRRSVRERLRPGAPLLYHRRRHRRPSTGCVCPNLPCWSCPARAPSPPCRSRASAPALEVCTGLEPSAAPIAAERPSCAPFLADRAWSSGPRAGIQGFPCFAVTSAFRIVIDAPCLPLP